jgi:phosphotransferase system enzyme I (PtsI)
VLLEKAMRDVARRGLAHAPKIPLGMMIEVPSAAVMADVFAKHADFFSIGTNDLVQYSLAVDRTNGSLAGLGSPYHPSILRLIRAVVVAGKERDVPVALCGAMASDPLALIVLLGLGVREVSMEAGAIPEIKEAIRRVTIEEAEAIAKSGLASESAEEVEETVRHAFAGRLSDLLAGEESST